MDLFQWPVLPWSVWWSAWHVSGHYSSFLSVHLSPLLYYPWNTESTRRNSEVFHYKRGQNENEEKLDIKEKEWTKIVLSLIIGWLTSWLVWGGNKCILVILQDWWNHFQIWPLGPSDKFIRIWRLKVVFVSQKMNLCTTILWIIELITDDIFILKLTCDIMIHAQISAAHCVLTVQQDSFGREILTEHHTGTTLRFRICSIFMFTQSLLCWWS